MKKNKFNLLGLKCRLGILAKGLPVIAGLVLLAAGTALADPPDSDGDGFADDIDPFPGDNGNYSSINGIYWSGDVFGDADGDSIPNYLDETPYPLPDGDGDGLHDGIDPVPNDAGNPSPYNGSSWGVQVYDDADGDGIANFWDLYPYDPTNTTPPADSDGDGLNDNNDPSPFDVNNWSPYNLMYWPGPSSTALLDDDNDGVANWYDSSP